MLFDARFCQRQTRVIAFLRRTRASDRREGAGLTLILLIFTWNDLVDVLDARVCGQYDVCHLDNLDLRLAMDVVPSINVDWKTVLT
jgi:hypothetical protein